MLADYSKFDILGLWYKSVYFGVENGLRVL